MRYPEESLSKCTIQEYLNEIWDRSVSIYHDSLSRVVNNQAENVASCNARVKIRLVVVTSTRVVSNERKKEREKEREGKTLTTKTSFLVRMALQRTLNFIFPLLLLLPCFRCYHILYRKFQKSKLPLLYRDTSQHCSVYSNRAYSNSLSLPLYPPYFTFLTFFSFSFSFFLPRLSHLPFPFPSTQSWQQWDYIL